MDQRLNDPATDRPRQILEPWCHPAGKICSVKQPAAGTMVGERDLRVITSTGPGEHPLPPIMVTERPPQPQVVAPRLELALRDIPRHIQPGGLPAIVSGARLEHDPGQPLIDDSAEMLVEQCGAEAWPGAAADRAARVADEPLRVLRARQDVAAVRTPGDPGEQPVLVLAGVVTGPADAVGSLPQVAVDDRRPGILDAQTPRPTENSERCLGPDDALHGARRPTLLAQRRRDAITDECVGDLAPPNSRGALLKDPADNRRSDRVDQGAAVLVAAVTERCLAGEPAGADRPIKREGDVLVGLVALPLGHDEQQAEHRASHRCRRVDLLGHADDPCTLVTELLDRRQATDDGAGKPVQAGDDHTAGLASFDASQRGVHSGPVHGAAGPVEVFMPSCDPDAVGLRPPLDRGALLAGRLEAFAAAASDLRDTDVAVHHLLSGGHPGIVQFAAHSQQNGEPTYKGFA